MWSSRPLLAFFLTTETEFGPGHGRQSLVVDLVATSDAFPKRTRVDPSKSRLHSSQQLPLLATSFEEVFAGSRLDTEISNFRWSIVVQVLPFLLHSVQEGQSLLTVGIESLLELLDLCLGCGLLYVFDRR